MAKLSSKLKLGLEDLETKWRVTDGTAFGMPSFDAQCSGKRITPRGCLKSTGVQLALKGIAMVFWFSTCYTC